MTKVRISDDALADLNDGHWFYEAQEPGLGDYFTSCLRGDIEGLKVSAGVHPIVYRDYHRLLSRVFPYGIFYTNGSLSLTQARQDFESLERATVALLSTCASQRRRRYEIIAGHMA